MLPRVQGWLTSVHPQPKVQNLRILHILLGHGTIIVCHSNQNHLMSIWIIVLPRVQAWLTLLHPQPKVQNLRIWHILLGHSTIIVCHSNQNHLSIWIIVLSWVQGWLTSVHPQPKVQNLRIWHILLGHGSIIVCHSNQNHLRSIWIIVLPRLIDLDSSTTKSSKLTIKFSLLKVHRTRQLTNDKLLVRRPLTLPLIETTPLITFLIVKLVRQRRH